MSDIKEIVGTRVRNQRLRRGLTQEALGERAGLHNTYIGQVERGEKNATLESLQKIVKALDISFATLFDKIDPDAESEKSIPAQCYELIDGLSASEQEMMFEVIRTILSHYKTD